MKRNIDRFPEDFAFKLTQEKCSLLRSHFATSDSSVTLDVGRGGRRYLPHAFTEHGVVMLANILRSKHAVEMSIEVVRAFIQMRKMLTSGEKFDQELRDLRDFVLKRAQKSDQEFRKVWQAIEKLSAPPNQDERRIGFDLK